MSEKRVVGRRVFIALEIVCIILLACLVGAISLYSLQINDKDNTITSLQSQINQLQTWLDGNKTLLNQTQTWLSGNITYYNSQIANLQNQLNSLMNGTETSLGIIVSNPSAWVNKTVVVQGALGVQIHLPWQITLWNYVLVSSNGINQIGVLWNGAVPNSSQVQIYGVVRQGLEGLVFYIKAETVDPI